VNVVLFFTEVLHVLALLLFLASPSVICLRHSQWYANLSLTCAWNRSSLFLQNKLSIGTQIYLGVRRIFLLVQMFVLGPRLILSVRARLQVDPYTGTGVTSIAFQEGVHVSSASSVYTQCD
jgi:hypothetical protein